MGDLFTLTKGNALFDSTLSATLTQPLDQAIDVSSYNSLDFQVNSLKMSATLVSYTVRILVALQRDNADYTWDQWASEVTISGAEKTFIMRAPDSMPPGKVLLRYIRWAVVNINGVGTGMFTVQGIARLG